jgi:hypothetical protein
MRGSVTINDQERRSRLARRHQLAPQARSDDVAAVTRSLVGLHSSDPVTVYLSAAQRMRHGSLAAVDDALYEERSVVRHHAMRRTLWVMPLDIAMAAHSASTSGLVKHERMRLANSLVVSGVTDDPHAWIDDACAALVRELAGRGEATTRELGEALPRYAVPITLSRTGAGSAPVAAHTRLLLLLGFVGATIRTRPLGTWVSGQYRWALATVWTKRAWSDELLPGKAAGQATIIDAYLRAFGPATERDVRWWTGWAAAQVAKALIAIDAIPVNSVHGPAYVAAGDLASDEDTAPWVALLPGLDPTAMGWKDRSWYVDDELARWVFDRNGNAGPTIWADGRIVGGWAQRPDGSIATQVCDLSATHRRLLADEVERVHALVGDTRFRTRFPSPLSRRLAATAVDQ